LEIKMMTFPRMRAACAAAMILLSAASPSVCGAETPSVGERPFPVATRAALDAALTKTLEHVKTPGVVVGIWIPGRGTYVVTRGVSDSATGKAMQRNDRFRIGSNTKTFTVTALLQLADGKKVGLDDPLSKYVSFVPNGKNITLRMLANMTSGLFSYTEDDAWVMTTFRDVQRTWTPRELVNVGLKHRPTFPPGTGWHYSNTNTVLLGMIVEQVSGKPIQQFYAGRIFKPLALQNTSWPTTSAIPAPYAHGITMQTLNGKQADATHRNPTWAFTAGQMISTLDDLKVWAKSYTTGSLLSREMQKQRLTFVSLPPNTKQKAYGLGIGVDHGWLGHTGELPGYNTGAYYLPEQDATMVVMANSDLATNGVSPVTAIFKALTKVVTPRNVPG
jgi:D-alanyl-D-alanine carboxypeptidase